LKLEIGYNLNDVVNFVCLFLCIAVICMIISDISLSLRF